MFCDNISQTLRLFLVCFPFVYIRLNGSQMQHKTHNYVQWKHAEEYVGYDTHKCGPKLTDAR